MQSRSRLEFYEISFFVLNFTSLKFILKNCNFFELICSFFAYIYYEGEIILFTPKILYNKGEVNGK